MISIRLRHFHRLVEANGLATRLPAREAGPYPLVLQNIPEPFGIATTVCNQRFSSRAAAPMSSLPCPALM